MKMVSYPPFIVFFDTIAVILFLLIMNQDQRITIDIVEDRLFNGSEIIYQKNNHYYKLSGVEYKSITDDYFLKCKPSIFQCKETIDKYNNAFIVLPDTLHTEIAKLTLLAITTKSCSNIKYSINSTGSIDCLRLEKDNPCFNKLSGFKERINNCKNSQLK